MNLTQKITFLLLMVVGLMVSQATAKTQDILELAEQFRGVSGASKLICDVATYRHDALQQQKTFHVYTASQQQSLVVFKSDRDKGKKMLMKGKDFWMFMPKSRRPIRITPMQKLLGEAALGDIASLRWTEQYQVISQQQDDKHLVLNLAAKSASASYQRIELSVANDDYFPLEAKLYLRSGVLAKVAGFTRGARNNKPAVTAMTLLDKMNKSNKTVIYYREIKPIEVPEKLFNPQILLRTNLDKLLAG